MNDKSIKYTYPKISKDWDYEKNTDLNIINFSKTSKKSVWWKCENGHCYKVSIHSRIRSNGCKICNSPLKKENIRKSKLSKGLSFAKAKPELLSEWNYIKNSLSPENVSEKSHLLFWFKCKQNHEWQSTPQRRSRGDGCPICSRANQGARIRKARLEKTGINLFKKHPELLSEWDFSKNKIDPNDISPNSNLNAFWKCKFGHTWEAQIYNRTGNNSGCPFCKSSTSKLEVFILCEMSKLFKNVKWRSKIEGYECDILLKNDGFGIEIDGAYWHDNKLERDLVKHKIFKDNNIYLIRVRDSSLPKIDGDVVLYDKKTQYIDLVIGVLKIISKINPKLKFDKYILDRIQIGENEFKKTLSLLPAPTEKESLLFINPDLAEEWNFSKNNPLTPDMFTANSEKKVYWKCKFGHIWEASIKNRHKRNSGCPICYRDNAGNNLRKSLLAKKGISFAQSHPDMLREWDYTMNTFNPNEISAGSSVKIYWKCVNGHTWLASVGSRTGKGYGCPSCSTSKRSLSARAVRIKKTGSLDLTFPEIAKEWDFSKNIKLPKDFPPGSKEKVWWLCPKGHSWHGYIYKRTKNKKTCPVCLNESVLKPKL